MRDNGAIEGASDGFAEDDEVIVMYDMSETGEKIHKVIGFKDGVRPCEPTLTHFRLYVGGALASYGGENIYVSYTDSDGNLIEQTMAIQTTESRTQYASEWEVPAAALAGVTVGGLNLSKLEEGTLITFKLMNYRTVDKTLQDAYKALANDYMVTDVGEEGIILVPIGYSKLEPAYMFYGFENEIPSSETKTSSYEDNRYPDYWRKESSSITTHSAESADFVSKIDMCKKATPLTGSFLTIKSGGRLKKINIVDIESPKTVYCIPWNIQVFSGETAIWSSQQMTSGSSSRYVWHELFQSYTHEPWYWSEETTSSSSTVSGTHYPSIDPTTGETTWDYGYTESYDSTIDTWHWTQGSTHAELHSNTTGYVREVPRLP